MIAFLVRHSTSDSPDHCSKHPSIGEMTDKQTLDALEEEEGLRPSRPWLAALCARMGVARRGRPGPPPLPVDEVKRRDKERYDRWLAAKKADPEAYREWVEKRRVQDAARRSGNEADVIVRPYLGPTQSLTDVSDEKLAELFKQAESSQERAFLFQCEIVSEYRARHIQRWGASWTDEAMPRFSVTKKRLEEYARLWEIYVGSAEKTRAQFGRLAQDRIFLLRHLGRLTVRDGLMALKAGADVAEQIGEAPTHIQWAHHVGLIAGRRLEQRLFPATASETRDADDATEHTKIEALLLTLGSQMGFDVWIAPGDRHHSFGSVRFSEIPRLLPDLPVQFGNSRAHKTIRKIDVLWLQDSSVKFAFEVESTTTIYSGLLRMSDLLLDVSNLRIPLFIVAPLGRREKVIEEIDRPTFSRPDVRMCCRCKLIIFEELERRREELTKYGRHLKASVLNDFAEDCHVIEGSCRVVPG